MKKRKNVSMTWQWRMKIMKEIHMLRLRKTQWQTLQRYSDIKLLSDKLKVSSYTISKAMKKGHGQYKILKAIDRFYTDRLNALIEERKQQQIIENEQSTIGHCDNSQPLSEA